MTFRARMLLGFAGVVLVPLALFGFWVRGEMVARLTGEYQRRVAALATVIRADVRRDGDDIARRLGALSDGIAADNRFRRAVLEGGDRTYLLDYAGGAMRSAGLSLLQIQDEAGRIVSSGHFRNEYDRLEPALPRLLAASQGGVALVRARTAEAPLIALARVDSALAGKRFTLVGGIALDSSFFEGLSPDPELRVAVVLPGDTASAGTAGAVVSELSLPFVVEPGGDSTASLRPARIVVSHSLDAVAALRRDVDTAFLAAVVVAGAIALLLAGWLSQRISRPLTALARKTAEIDMDRLDVAFDSDRTDEIGALTRLLGAMTERLRAGAAKLREAERRIAMGDLARQVNHDIKNGLLPIRNVFRHFAETAADPARLAAVFRERQGTVESSISYLEGLAANYARLYPEPARAACDVRQVIRETIGRLSATGAAELKAELPAELPVVCIDQLVLRRILENLIGNALDSLPAGAGCVTIAAAAGAPADGHPMVRITVADTGKGMTQAELDRAFEGFHSTKPGGTGLGLSIVRRLVLDANGALRVETKPGAGSRFIVELPGHP